MGTYDSMKSRLLPTGLYSLTGSTAVDYELQAYAAGLDPLCDDFKTLQKESFVATAEDYGLIRREKSGGITFPASENEKRRAALYALGAVTQNSDTKTELENLLATLGIPVQITEDAPNKTLTVHFLKEPYGGRAAAQKTLEKFMPAHLTIVSDFSGIS